MDEFISTVPAAYQEIYRRHWNTIKTSVKIGILKDVYNFSIANYGRPFHRLVNHLNTIRTRSDKWPIQNQRFFWLHSQKPMDRGTSIF